MKKELLCPVGSKDAGMAAIHNGADAVYLAGLSFGARAYAPNFSNEELVEFIKYAHLYDVKVYVTVNTLIKDIEIEEAIKFIEFLHLNNVDAIILQDIGLASIINKMFPNLELHASTQMHNIDKFSALFLKKLGFKRIILARELSLEEIDEIDTDLELEVFIHGALCMSYSGECLLSSMAMNRSGNRGSCSQLCRMPYSLYIDDNFYDKGGRYLLSPKDISTATIFDKIMNSKITSLKVEGRMKSPEYVAAVTKLYRKLIDSYYDNNEIDIKEDENVLKKLFNRGYGTGHLIDSNNTMNIKRGNHLGVKIGETLKVEEKFITIKLNDNLHVGDGIKFDNVDKGMNVFNIYKNREIVKEGIKGDIISIPNNIGLKENDTVLKTLDVKLNDTLKNYDEKKLPLDIEVIAKINKKLKVIMKDKYNEFSLEGEIVEVATNKDVSHDDIKEKISKLGNTIYKVNNLNIDKDDNIFIRLSDLNNLRREVVEKLVSMKEDVKNNFVKNEINIDFVKENIDEELSVYVRNEEQLSIVKTFPVKRIYTNDYELYKSNKDLNIFYEVNVNDNMNLENDKLLINSTSDIIKYKDNEKVLNYSLNIYNSHTINYLKEYGIPTISPEFTLEEFEKISRKLINLPEVLIYGKVKVMTMKHCLVYDKPICDSCKFKNSNKKLEDDFKRRYTIICNNGVNYLYDHKDILKIKDIDSLRFYGYKRFRIDFLNELESDVKKILSEFFTKK